MNESSTQFGDRGACEHQVATLASTVQAHQARKHDAKGQLKAIEIVMRDLDAQLAGDTFKGIDDLVVQREIEVDTTRKAAADLEKWHKVCCIWGGGVYRWGCI